MRNEWLLMLTCFKYFAFMCVNSLLGNVTKNSLQKIVYVKKQYREQNEGYLSYRNTVLMLLQPQGSKYFSKRYMVRLNLNLTNIWTIFTDSLLKSGFLDWGCIISSSWWGFIQKCWSNNGDTVLIIFLANLI